MNENFWGEEAGKIIKNEDDLSKGEDAQGVWGSEAGELVGTPETQEADDQKRIEGLKEQLQSIQERMDSGDLDLVTGGIEKMKVQKQLKDIRVNQNDGKSPIFRKKM